MTEFGLQRAWGLFLSDFQKGWPWLCDLKSLGVCSSTCNMKRFVKGGRMTVIPSILELHGPLLAGGTGNSSQVAIHNLGEVTKCATVGVAGAGMVWGMSVLAMKAEVIDQKAEVSSKSGSTEKFI